jgi:hypothetical protein
MHLDLSDEEAAALTKEFADITGNGRYSFAEARPHPEGDPSEAQARADRRGPFGATGWYVPGAGAGKSIWS